MTVNFARYAPDGIKSLLLSAVINADNNEFILHALNAIDPYRTVFLKDGTYYQVLFTDIIKWWRESKYSTCLDHESLEGDRYLITYQGKSVSDESYASEDDAKIGAFRQFYDFDEGKSDKQPSAELTSDHITKMILIFNAKHGNETVAKTYTKEDEHLAEQHAKDFKKSVLTQHESIRIVKTSE